MPTKFLLTLVFALPAAAGELKLLPEDPVLTGPESFQRLILVELEAGKVVADRTAEAVFASSDPKVATIDKDGTARAAGDGSAKVTATVAGKSASAVVRVVGSTGAPMWSFRNQVIPVLSRLGCNSGGCHGALAGKGGLKLSLRGYDPDADHFALTRQAQGRRVDPAHPDESLLLTKPTAQVKHGGGLKLHEGTLEHRVIHEWIAAGCPAPAANEPHVVKLESFPAEAVLAPGAKLQVIVRARMSDGSTRDVTRWVRFGSSEELTAPVDPEGRASVIGFGEAAVTVVYANLVTTVRIAAPRSRTMDPKVFAGAARANFIDEHILRKLQSLGIPPSPRCTDHEFIRRAFLDTIGTLPTPAEVTAFAADQAPDKRARLVDQLLSRPEYVDYWSYKWADLLLVSSRLPSPAMWSFHDWIRRGVADNKPWDRFARDILTASGSTLDNGAGNFFVLHKDLAELNETVSVTFLGVSLTCARCHNHPLEKWTQDQYYRMANLFSRVRMKNGDRAGEVIVYAAPTGDYPHPRTGIPEVPQPPDGPPMDIRSAADRRAFFADWLVDPKNPFFARAVVNRVWKNHFGRGLFESEEDQRDTNPATNEELLAALANDFVRNKYDMKHLLRTLMASEAYQRSSKPVPGNEADDRYGSHYLVRRLSAEVILDAYTQISGVPTDFRGRDKDRRPTPVTFPLGTRAQQLPDVRVASAFLDAFGRPDREQTCSCERSSDSSVGQSLHLNNGESLNRKLQADAGLIAAWLKAKISDDDAITQTFLMCLSRPPTDPERTRLRALLAEAAAESNDPKSRRAALEDLVWSVATGKEFLFNH